VAVTNLLRVAQRQVDDPEKVEGLLAMAIEELSRGHAELRDLARGLHPVALGERGLRAAVASLAATCTVQVGIDVTDAPLPENVALAAYFVVAESLANAQKHARATVLRIRATRDGDALVVEVRDDGVGGADVGAGTGLCGLQDRIEALGGRLDVVSPAGGGTRVRAVVPLGD
jgi:signal transduction histidine kinase